MNKQVAVEIAENYLARWRRVAVFSELALMEENGDKDWENVIERDGEEYKALFYVLPDSDGCLRMVVAVNDRSFRSSVAPVTRDEIMRPDGSYRE
ncbi:hypothetical protein HII36_06415 [Nonomuraea sp. NN258]|uniref:hypothetical protein n=1 Tax=Nonomuraea antri TaxID=2730852 RepID=UPI00156A52A0|nr:hypothetical protein [Nonomuraea antri]NRQ31474.1 hypothetical protein [Nonomuraea antri]